MRSWVDDGLDRSPAKDPAVAAKVSASHAERVNQGRWKRLPCPRPDPESGCWLKGRESS